MVCGYCKSDIFYLKDSEGKTGLYCQSCGRWLKWVDSEEKAKIQSDIEKEKERLPSTGRTLRR